MHFWFIFNYLVLLCLVDLSNGLLKRCFVCRSRGELGSCKDPFAFNVTDVEFERGIDTSPCASGWCGKIVESENDLKEDMPLRMISICGSTGFERVKIKYGVATQRICLQRGPSDSEDRCAYTKWQFRRVLMCFCRGDLCNYSTILNPTIFLLICTTLIKLLQL